MDARRYMIVDLERRGSRQMFLTENVSSITLKDNGLWAVRFSSSSRVFNYNPARLLCLTDPQVVDLGDKGLYINNKHICNAVELLRFTDGQHTFYRVTYQSGYYENLEGKQVYITRTTLDQHCGSLWQYLVKLAAETGLSIDGEQNILSKQYELVDLYRDNVPLAQYYM